MTNTRGKHRFDIVLELEAPIETCYEVCYREEHMAHWVPLHKSVVYDQSGAQTPYGPGASRLITQTRGNTLREHIVQTNKPQSMVYAIYTFGKPMDWLVHNYQGHIQFEPISADRTRLTWSIHYDLRGPGKPLAPLLKAAFKKLIGGMCRTIQNTSLRFPDTATLPATKPPVICCWLARFARKLCLWQKIPNKTII